MKRLLLVEFAVVDSFQRAVVFPYLQGAARAQGLETRWLRFAVAADARLRQEERDACLAPEDLAALAAAQGGFGAAHVVFDRRPARSVVLALEGAAPGARYGCLQDGRGQPAPEGESPAVVALSPRGGALPRFLGLPEQDGWGPPEGLPDYAWLPGNEAARRAEPVPFVLLGDECTYNRSAAGNPFFAGLDLSASQAAGGCSFCRRPPRSGARADKPVELLERQLAAVEKTCPRSGERLAVRVAGEPALLNVEAVAGLLARTPLRPLDLLLDGRADALVRAAPALERALKALDGTPHRLCVGLVGLENFCSRELERYNKGLTAATNLELVRLLLRLERSFPAHFDFRRRGGLSMLTFNCWTRPHELDVNFAVAELLGLEPLLGKLFTGRLRLYPGLPLEAKARRDGLLRERYDDPLLETARRTFYDAEFPWRFQDPAMEALGRVLLRFEAAPPGESEPLYGKVRRLLREGAEAGVSPAELGQALVQAALRLSWERPGAATPERLVARASRSVAAAAGGARGRRRSWLSPDWKPPRDFQRRLAEKPVLKLEPVRAEDAEAWRARADLPNARCRPAAPQGAEASWEVFCGLNARDVERALALTRGESAPAAGEDPAAATEELGRLLGYPACCARAFARRGPALQGRYAWSHVVNRLRRPGPAPWELNPAGLEYVPCSLDCRASLELARRRPASDRRARSLARPWLLLLGEEDGTAVELLPETPVAERFRYRGGRMLGGGPDARLARAGDELLIEPEAMLVLKDGRPLGSLSGRAFLWWTERVFQAEFWTALAALKAEAVPAAARPERERAPDGRARAFFKLLDERFEKARGLPCRSLFDGENLAVSIGAWSWPLWLKPARLYDGPRFCRTPRFVLGLRGEVPMPRAQQDHLLAYARLLARYDAVLARILEPDDPADGP